MGRPAGGGAGAKAAAPPAKGGTGGGKRGRARRRLFTAGRIAFVFLCVLLLRWGWLWVKAGPLPASRDQGAPSIVYGRPFPLRPGDALDAGALRERLERLSYRKVRGTPSDEGTYSTLPDGLRLCTRGFRAGGTREPVRQAEVLFEDGRIRSLKSLSGRPREAVLLEPEEFSRFLGPGGGRRRPVALAAVPAHLRDAVLAAEDSRFYSHFGIDLAGTARAALVNLRRRRFAQGGSTITQQLAKNLFLTPEKSIWRKLREAELAVLLELRHGKDEILEAYLNEIYLGQSGPQGIFGVEEAARAYFSRPAAELTLAESALLAGMIRAPNRYAPQRHREEAGERRNEVLERMGRLGMIDGGELRRALAAPVDSWVREEGPPLGRYFTDQVARLVEESLPGASLSGGGYGIYTSLDPLHQEAAETAVREGLGELEGRDAARESSEPLQAALVAIDAATGEVTAMVGGRDYGETQFNRAVDARRQPGSAFKPFVLLEAMESAVAGRADFTLAATVSGEPVTVASPGGAWTPENFDRRRYGRVTLREMIEESVNTAAVRFALDLGLERVVERARLAGITSPLSPVPSLALGSFEVTPLELAGAYATLAAGGVRREPRVLLGVTARDGSAAVEVPGKESAAADPRAAFLVTYALEGVLDRGTGRRARSLGLEGAAAGKTGTSDGYRDSWFAGYSPDLVCVVWVGRDSGGGTGLTGSAGALEIWARFMKAAGGGGGGRAFPVPGGIRLVEIDPESGLRATSNCPSRLREAFPEELAPSRSCPLHPGNPIAEGVRKGFRGVRNILKKIFRKR